MSTTEDNSIALSDLLKKEPTQIDEWLNHALIKDPAARQDPSRNTKFNWHGLAESAGTKASLGNNLEWARVSIRVYKYLELAEPEGDVAMNSFLFSAMLLKCSMISRLGAVEGHLVLDPKPITQLLADVNESPAQILAEVALWNQIRGKKELEPQDIKRVKLLRRIRHRIYFVKFLVESEQLVPDTQQMAWLSIHSKLP